ncbi:hypothetical protein CBM2615_B60007 [Cupriavidus taiwanensis]|uniref:Uncharacterized protein n=1 Tax=Cupriavidus taiwanensis TaxID=164546 RepID=A0A375EC29_9BURK|nr:hypothetical protein CBM2614_B50007 [Cupriavidus taiwanensis]SOZ69644.1 hypothetical protein CBM2615_B60007 [Cupriavidus taiwanensis]SOZ72859.1 hypothetical protein CBM2613_B50007 [Cupriavidus taiwanensis]SPA09718.1 hypothetical protein CBM2625_B50007 [Cupriavidus taiwanensis]
MVGSAVVNTSRLVLKYALRTNDFPGLSL